MKQSFENGRNSNNNIFNNNKPAQNILEIKTVKTKSFFDTSNKVEDIKKQNVIKKNESKNNKFIQVNTKRKNVFLNNYDLNKVIFIQRYIKIKYSKNNWKNQINNFIQKIKKIFLSKIFFRMKENIRKINKKKQKKNVKTKLLSINTNFYNTNKISTHNTETNENSSYCKTTKHNKIMNYVNYKLNLIQANTMNNENNNINEIKNIKLFSPKIKSKTDRQNILLKKIKSKNSIKKIRYKEPKLEKFKTKNIITNDIDNNNILYYNETDKNITKNSLIDKENYQKLNNYKINNSKNSKFHRKGLSYNLDFFEQSYKDSKNSTKELIPKINKIKNKNPKNNRNIAIKTETNKVRKINTLFNSKDNISRKAMNTKVYENNLYKDITNKNKNKNKKVEKIQDKILKVKKEKSKKELKPKNNNNKEKTKNNKPKKINDIDIKSKYFKIWKANSEKKNILMKFIKFSKYFNHMNHYEKIILIKNNIQKLINFQKKEDIIEFFLKIKKKIIIEFMKKLKEYKKIDANKDSFDFVKENNNIDKLNKLKIIIKLFENHKNNFNNDSSKSYNLLKCFKKWKKILIMFPKIKEKTIEMRPFKTKILNTNPNDNNSDNTSLKNKLSPNKLSPKIINVINVQNYNENNNYNYNFKCIPMKGIPIYPIKQRNSFNYNTNHLNINTNNNNKNINVYHKKKLGNTHINNNYNFNFNNMTENNFDKKLNDNENKQKYGTYDTSSLLFNFQNNNSEIISLDLNNKLYKGEYPEEKFGFKKSDQIEEKEINFFKNSKEINNKNNDKLYIKKQNLDKKHIYFTNQRGKTKTIKNRIKCLNIQFDNKNEEIIKREKNNFIDNKLRLNKIFSSKNFFTENNCYEKKDDEDKMNKSFNAADMNSKHTEDYRITNSNFNNN